MLPDRQTAEKAIARSRAKDPKLARVTKITCGVYRVQGDHGLYTVTVSAQGFECDCVAGMNGRTCYHKSSVWRMRCADRMVAAPAPKPLPAGLLDDEACPSCGFSTGHNTRCAAQAVAA